MHFIRVLKYISGFLFCRPLVIKDGEERIALYVNCKMATSLGSMIGEWVVIERHAVWFGMLQV